MPRKSEWWFKSISNNPGGTPNEISTKDMVSDLTYTKTIDFDGKPINARWLQVIDEPDLKVIVERADRDSVISPFSDRPPTIITYRRREDE